MRKKLLAKASSRKCEETFSEVNARGSLGYPIYTSSSTTMVPMYDYNYNRSSPHYVMYPYGLHHGYGFGPSMQFSNVRNRQVTTEMSGIGPNRAPLRDSNGRFDEQNIKSDTMKEIAKKKPIRAYTGKPKNGRPSLNKTIGKRKKMYSDYVGVTFNKTHNKYQACITHFRRQHYLGRYRLASDAAKAYDDSAKKLKGPDWKTNFCSEEEYQNARLKEEKSSGTETYHNGRPCVAKSTNKHFLSNAGSPKKIEKSKRPLLNKAPILTRDSSVTYEAASALLSLCLPNQNDASTN